MWESRAGFLIQEQSRVVTFKLSAFVILLRAKLTFKVWNYILQTGKGILMMLEWPTRKEYEFKCLEYFSAYNSLVPLRVLEVNTILLFRWEKRVEWYFQTGNAIYCESWNQKSGDIDTVHQVFTSHSRGRDLSQSPADWHESWMLQRIETFNVSNSCWSKQVSLQKTIHITTSWAF